MMESLSQELQALLTQGSLLALVNHWVVQVFLIFLCTALIHMGLRALIRRWRRYADRTRHWLDNALSHAIYGPLGAMVWLSGVAGALAVLPVDGGRNWMALFERFHALLTAVIVTWFVMRMVHFSHRFFLAKQVGESKWDRSSVDAMAKLIRLVVMLTGTLVVIQDLGYSVSGVLAFGGIGGIAIGFAAKDLLANFFGGLMIYLDRPFAVGDWIRSPDRDIEGTVEYVGWRLTRIRTFDKRPLYVPNGIFANIALENPSRMTHRRIYETMGVRYQDLPVMPTVIAAVRQMLYEHPEVDENNTLIVNFNTFGDSALEFFVYCMTHTTNWQHYHEVKQDVLLQIADLVTAQGAAFAFPTQTLHLIDEAGVGQHA